MKYIKTFLLASCLPLFIVSCDSSDDNPINTVTATVQFEKAEINMKESVKFLSLPIYITSDKNRDGDVFIKVTMKENNANFELDKDVILTTETLRIPAGVESVNFESAFKVETEDINKGRNITFHIANAEGASIGTNASCKIDIIEKNFIEGTYLIRGLNAFDDLMSSGKCYITGEDETLDHVSLDFGLGGSARVEFTEKIPDREWTVKILPFEYVGNFGGSNVFLSWSFLKESTGDLLYDKEKPINGKFEKKQENGKEKLIFTFTDGFGLIGSDSAGKLSWFYNVWRENSTMEKEN